MTPEERASLKVESVKGTVSQNLLEGPIAKNLALQHLFERASVARELHAAGMLLRRGIGRVSVEEARVFASTDDFFVRPGSDLVTTPEVLAEEAALLAAVKAGQGGYAELGCGASSGKDVFVVAPSSSGVEILKQQGFATLDTFQKLMDSASLQDVARGKIVWIDEAGFFSTRQMRWAVDFAARNDCRLILSGDTRQHHAVERGKPGAYR
jgi:hypothetical protein